MESVIAIDIGNSATKIGFFINGHLEETETLPSEKDHLDVLEAQLRQELQALETIPELSAVVLSSVVPALTPIYETVLRHWLPEEKLLRFTREHLQDVQLGDIDLSAYAPNQLGTDRIANIMAGRAQYPDQLLMICDVGTTTTFDMVDEQGHYVGGAICPGPRLFQTLVKPQHAAQLNEVDVFQTPSETPGLSTQSSLENGLYYGYKGAILEILGNLLQQAGWPLSQTTLIFTGGDARPVREMLSFEIPTVHIDPKLTLYGLYQVWQRHAQPAISTH